MKLIAKEFNELTTTELYEILKARAAIFIMEQNINYQDMDDIDYKSTHFFYMEDNKVIAYLRAFEDEEQNIKIGRVLTIEHGKGIGKKLFTESLISIIEKKVPKKIYMHAQTHATGFYEQFGFKPEGEEFLEEGIQHIQMELELH